MPLKLYNSYGRRLQAFRPRKKGEVRMYTCGPTVWDYAHIGNFRTFLFEDLLRRYLKLKGLRVVQVKNITDVEDKIIQGMKKTGMSRAALSKFYEDAFMEDLATLGIERAEYYPRASEHVPEMIALVKKLMVKGYAYKGDDGSTYYRVSRFKKYGRLSGMKSSDLRSTGRVSHDHYDKEEARDFALWKAWDEQDGDVYWETELGKGRPGWHVECSAMSMKYLGESFDIHAGGKDLKFPHHENEIAQSEAATGKRLARYWLHSDFLNVEGQEMHKSSGNIVKLRELLQRGWNPLTVRLFLISAHYRDPIDLTENALRQAEAKRDRLQQLITRLSSATDRNLSGQVSRTIDSLLRRFTAALDEDLNSPKAFAALFAFVKKVNRMADSGMVGRKEAKEIISALKRVDSVLGVMRFEQESLDSKFLELIKQREEARKKKNFVLADELRVRLLESGVELEDTPQGTIWKLRPHAPSGVAS